MSSRNNKAGQRKRERNRKFINEYRTGKRCVDCAIEGTEQQPLQFHHLDRETKRSGISEMVSSARPLITIQREIEKCVLLCNDCHRKRHGYLRNALDTERQRV